MHIEIPDAPFPTCGWIIHEPTSDLEAGYAGWTLEVQIPARVRDLRGPGRAVYGTRSFKHYADALAFASHPDMMLQMVCDVVLEQRRQLERLERELRLVDPTGRKFRALLTLDSIRDDILTVGWPLGDDSDQEVTPRRLVQELLDVVHQHGLIPGKP
jgi:hypothetical protein